MSEKGEVTMSEYEYLLEMRNIVKSFPGVKALDGAKLLVRPGTVHALMGNELDLSGIMAVESPH